MRNTNANENSGLVSDEVYFFCHLHCSELRTMPQHNFDAHRTVETYQLHIIWQTVDLRIFCISQIPNANDTFLHRHIKLSSCGAGPLCFKTDATDIHMAAPSSLSSVWLHCSCVVHTPLGCHLPDYSILYAL